MIEVLYPENYEVPAKASEPTVKDTTKLKAFISELTKNVPVSVPQIVKLVDEEYVKTNDEDMHFLAPAITAVCAEIEEERRPTKDKATLPEAGL